MENEYPLIVATNAKDSCAYPMDFLNVHKQGILHRTVHIEIINSIGKYFVWERKDGRLEIPGGHVDWLRDHDRPESYEEAAIREIFEELNLKKNWKLTLDLAKARLIGKIFPIKRLINQIPSSHGNNNEWVTVFVLHWKEDEWKDPCNFVLSIEGNKTPCWLSLEEIEQRSLKNPMGINSALRLFLRRRGILIPIYK